MEAGLAEEDFDHDFDPEKANEEFADGGGTLCETLVERGQGRTAGEDASGDVPAGVETGGATVLEPPRPVLPSAARRERALRGARHQSGLDLTD
eukprot:11137553-Lingulodinium_polyedra.AAC.1